MTTRRRRRAACPRIARRSCPEGRADSGYCHQDGVHNEDEDDRSHEDDQSARVTSSTVSS